METVGLYEVVTNGWILGADVDSCPYCGGTDVYERGTVKGMADGPGADGSVVVWYCEDCGEVWYR